MMKKYKISIIATIIMGSISMSACNAKSESSSDQQISNINKISQDYRTLNIATFNEPWAMIELPNKELLITERKGKLKLFNPQNNKTTEVKGIPKVAYGGQGGLGDIALHPNFEKNNQIYISYAESGDGGYGAVVIRGELDLVDSNHPQIKNIQTIWKQVPKVSGQGHYSHRILFGKDGKLWISSGERQKFDPAQDMKSNLGKILRLNDDGTAAEGNPFNNQGEIAQQVWSLGHRNPLGIAFDHQGQLWDIEMGPKGGDELNKVIKGENYGYPIVSNGDHYSGKDIPDHHTRPEFKAPELSWTPVISPSSMIFYNAELFPLWKNKALIGGLSSESIVVVDTEKQPAIEIQRLDMKQRIRDIKMAHDGGIWVIEDGKNAKLLKLMPK